VYPQTWLSCCYTCRTHNFIGTYLSHLAVLNAMHQRRYIPLPKLFKLYPCGQNWPRQRARFNKTLWEFCRNYIVASFKLKLLKRVIRLYTGNSKRYKPTGQHDNIIFRLQWTTLPDRTLYSVINSLRIPMFYGGMKIMNALAWYITEITNGLEFRCLLSTQSR